jgi:hypothetical protein
MNECAHIHENTGARTDILAITNSGSPPVAMLANPSTTFVSAFESATHVLLPRNRWFSLAKRIKAGRRPTRAHFIDHSTMISNYARSRGKSVTMIGVRDNMIIERNLAAMQNEPFIMPSTGAIVASYFVRRAKPSDRVVLAGFSHSGWSGHPWFAERRLFEIFSRSPMVSILQ